MRSKLNGVNRRDSFLVFLGASAFYIFNAFVSNSPSLVKESLRPPSYPKEHVFEYHSDPIQPNTPVPPKATDFGTSRIPETKNVMHVPGWTLFQNLYMANGTLFVVTSDPSAFPPTRMMISTGLIALNSPENIQAREPTDQELQIITPEEAHARWGGNLNGNERHRIWSADGISMLVNEPVQFLDHYYHFVAELMFGAWAFIYGVFNPHANILDSSLAFGRSPTDPSLSSFNPPDPTDTYQAPPLSRIMFLHASANQWKDKPGFNAYFFHAVFPSLFVETSEDWIDRSNATFVNAATIEQGIPQKAWHFPLALLSDRSAAFRGEACGLRNQRIASEPWEYLLKKGGIDPVGQWWGDVRHRLYRFAGIEKDHQVTRHLTYASEITDSDPQTVLPLPSDEIIITYINRQSVRRHLIAEDHEALVQSITEMVARKKAEGKNWVFRDVKPERLTKDEQVKLASETTIMLGVHGNGLSHLIWMQPNRYSSVIEILYPGGFAHDYEWTSRSLGMRHYSVWNDTVHTYPNEPEIGYPEGFQGTSIPVHGPTVAKLIEDRLEGRLRY